MIRTVGKVYENERGVWVLTQRPPVANLGDDVEIVWHDRRQISAEQRRKAYALMAEIADWSGNEPDDVKNAMKVDFQSRTFKHLSDELFSLSTCDMATARGFISFLIDFMLENDVPAHVPLVQLADDIERYVYACAIHKKCAVCGRRAEIHHVDRVGMGGNRREMAHIGLRALPLCRMHHQQAHEIGDRELMEREHIEAITIDERIAKINKLGRFDNGT